MRSINLHPIKYRVNKLSTLVENSVFSYSTWLLQMGSQNAGDARGEHGHTIHLRELLCKIQKQLGSLWVSFPRKFGTGWIWGYFRPYRHLESGALWPCLRHCPPSSIQHFTEILATMKLLLMTSHNDWTAQLLAIIIEQLNDYPHCMTEQLFDNRVAVINWIAWQSKQQKSIGLS